MAAGDEQLQKSVFKWVRVADEKRGIAMKHNSWTTAREVAETYGVPEEALVEHVAKQIYEAESCQSLPFTLLMVFAYMGMVLLHDPVVPVNAVEDALAHDIDSNANFAYTSSWVGHKGLMDVNSAADFWSFMIKGFLPLIFIQSKGFGEGADLTDPDYINASYDIPRKDRGFVLNYNRLVGGVRLTQERVGEIVCDTPGTLKRFRNCAGGQDYELYPELWQAYRTNNPQREFWLWASDDVAYLESQLYDKETEGWLDRSTKKIEILMPVYNTELGIYCHFTVNFFFSRGGHIWKRMIAMSTYSKWFDGYASMFVDGVWAFCLMYILFTELKEMGNAMRDGGCKGVMRQYFNYWRVIDWVSVAVGGGIIAYFIHVYHGSDALNQDLKTIASVNEETNRDHYRLLCKNFAKHLNIKVHQVYTFRVATGVYPVIIVLRLFKAFAAQARLSIVTKALSAASIDLVHFLLVFSSVFLTYTISGIVLFGREVDGFTTLERAVMTCFRAMMGDFDWDALQEVGRIEAGIWFCSFMVVIVLLMLNMLLAIVMEAYAEQKEQMQNAETVWMEAKQNFQRFQGRWNGQLVGLRDVLKGLQIHSGNWIHLTVHDPENEDNHDAQDAREIAQLEGTAAASRKTLRMFSVKSENGTDDRKDYYSIVTIDQLRELLDMSTAQAVELIENAVQEYYQANVQATDQEEMVQVIRKLNKSTKLLKNKIKEADAQMEEEAAGHAKEGAQLSGIDFELDDENDDLDEKKVPRFIHSLTVCHEELTRLREWISKEETDVLPVIKLDATEDGDPTATDPAHPLTNLEQAPLWCVRQVLDDQEAVLQACRTVGIGDANDDMRLRSLGKHARIIHSESDNTVQCRVPGVGDIWFGLGALSHPRHRPKDSKDNASIGSNRSGIGIGTMADLVRKAQGLESDLQLAHETKAEVVSAVTEMEWRLLREHEEKNKVASKFQLLKKKVIALTRENSKLRDESDRLDERLDKIETSKDEYAVALEELEQENARLKAQLAGEEPPLQMPMLTDGRSPERHHEPHSNGWHETNGHHRSDHHAGHHNGHHDDYHKDHHKSNHNGLHNGHHNGQHNGHQSDHRHHGDRRNGHRSHHHNGSASNSQYSDERRHGHHDGRHKPHNDGHHRDGHRNGHQSGHRHSPHNGHSTDYTNGHSNSHSNSHSNDNSSGHARDHHSDHHHRGNYQLALVPTDQDRHQSRSHHGRDRHHNEGGHSRGRGHERNGPSQNNHNHHSDDERSHGDHRRERGGHNSRPPRDSPRDSGRDRDHHGRQRGPDGRHSQQHAGGNPRGRNL